eukprot:359257-Chlamydomonas_euryale.AAC.2
MNLHLYNNKREEKGGKACGCGAFSKRGCRLSAATVDAELEHFQEPRTCLHPQVRRGGPYTRDGRGSASKRPRMGVQDRQVAAALAPLLSATCIASPMHGLSRHATSDGVAHPTHTHTGHGNTVIVSRACGHASRWTGEAGQAAAACAI